MQPSKKPKDEASWKKKDQTGKVVIFIPTEAIDKWQSSTEMENIPQFPV